MSDRHHTQLSLDERIQIQKGIENGKPFNAIASEIGKDRSTVSREVKRNRKRIIGASRQENQPCMHMLRRDCSISHSCGRPCMKMTCKGCPSICNQSCPGYSLAVCELLLKPPYVCNACRRRGVCQKDRFFYDPLGADRSYRETLSSSRSGISISEDERQRIGSMLHDGLSRGLSLHQIISGHGEDAIGLSESTLYRYIKEGAFYDMGIGPLSLPRRMYKPRSKGIARTYKVDKHCLEGRTYEDWQAFRAGNPEASVVQMDSVLGSPGSSCCLLTIHFTDTHLMLAFPRERNTAGSVGDAIDSIWSSIGHDAFRDLFPAILTDNGSEFSDPVRIEMDGPTGELRTRVFYCHPYSSWEKGACEVNHEFIRRIIPKGAAMDLSREQAGLMMSHINSCPRKSLGGRSPYEAFVFFHENGEDILSRLGIQRIPHDQILLKPELLERLF